MDASPAGVGKLAYTARLPIGVVGAISPFNFPFNLVAHKVAPALAAGCAVVLKPASQTPLSALLLAELEAEAGLPAGWLNVLVGRASEIGDVLVEDERVRLISFTGSAEVGWKLRERAARKKVLLELGNATPVIVEADADVEDAAAKAAANAFSFAGQSCISIQRVYVAQPAYEDFVAAFIPKVEALQVGDPADDATDVGPVIDEDAKERILDWIEEAKAQGATVLAGGETNEDGLIAPTVLGDVTPEMKVSCLEVFGPLCTVTPYDLARRGFRARQRDGVRAPGGHLHQRRQDGHGGRVGARVRRRARERSADVPGRPDAVRRRQGIGEHEGGAALLGARDDRGTAGRPRALTAPLCAWSTQDVR